MNIFSCRVFTYKADESWALNFKSCLAISFQGDLLLFWHSSKQDSGDLRESNRRGNGIGTHLLLNKPTEAEKLTVLIIYT